MNLSEGQKLALEQLREIESQAKDAFEIVAESEHSKLQDFIVVKISISTSDYKQNLKGLKFLDKENLNVFIHRNFPYAVPEVAFTHIRFAGIPHVQWGSVICLYQSKDVEWDPEDGIFGFLTRLDLWLQKAALGDLDPVDAPMHPPVTYSSNKNLPMIIPIKDTPDFNDDAWYGYAILDFGNSNVAFIKDWVTKDKLKRKLYVAPTILLSTSLSFEFPESLNDLLEALKNSGITSYGLMEFISKAAIYNGKNSELFVVIGVPMRGMVKKKKQHLTAWHLNKQPTKNLRNIFGRKPKNLKEVRKADSHLKKFISWAINSKLDWCPVQEYRPQIVLPRDMNTPLSWFKGKKVAIWGCGAIGSHIAEMIVRVGAQKIILIDDGLVTPGIISRQLYNEEDIGKSKSQSLRNRLERIYYVLENVKIESYHTNVLSDILSSGVHKDIDIIIDSTASRTVLKKLEDKFHYISDNSISVASLVIGRTAKYGTVSLVKPFSLNGPLSITRQAKIELCKSNENLDYLDEFYPLTSPSYKDVFQPEPGCSSPTFIGSEADVTFLSSSLLNLIASDLITSEKFNASVNFIKSPINNSIKQNYYESYYFNDSIQLIDINKGYKVRLSHNAWNDIKRWIDLSKNELIPPNETGGLLFGEWDDVCKIVHITEAIGPPTDSEASPKKFICGVEGTIEANESFNKKYRNSVYFVGLWHTHPFSSPSYSKQDKESMILVVTELSPPKSLLLIVGYDDKDYKQNALVFHKSEFN